MLGVLWAALRCATVERDDWVMGAAWALANATQVSPIRSRKKVAANEQYSAMSANERV